MAKIPWHFFKIPWQFPDLEKILFFPDFSLTRGNPATTLENVWLHFVTSGFAFLIFLKCCWPTMNLSNCFWAVSGRAPHWSWCSHSSLEVTHPPNQIFNVSHECFNLKKKQQTTYIFHSYFNQRTFCRKRFWTQLISRWQVNPKFLTRYIDCVRWDKDLIFSFFILSLIITLNTVS